MKMLFLGVVLVFVSSGVSSLKYTDCGSIHGTVADVTVSGCENVDVCPLKRGTNSSIVVNFKSGADTTTTKVVVHGIISGVPMPFPPPYPNGCEKSGISCPLKNGESYHYSTEIQVKSFYPPVNVNVKWELQDDNGKDLFCVLIPTKLV